MLDIDLLPGYTPYFEQPLSFLQNRTSFLQTTNHLRNKNLRESLKEIRKYCATLDRKNKLILLTQKLNKIETEKAGGFCQKV